MRLLILVIVTFIFHSSLFAQLSGSYTVGDTTDDFPNVHAAIDSINSTGMSGNIQLIVRVGTYSSLYISSFGNPNNHNLEIRSANGNPDSVVFNDCQILYSKNVTIRNIGFYKFTSNGLSLVKIYEGINVRLSNCRIIDNVTSKYNSQLATLTIKHASWPSPQTSVYIDSCYISCGKALLPQIGGPNTINEGGQGQSHFTADSIFGDWEVNSDYRKFIRCYLYVNDGIHDGGNKLFESCTIDFYTGDYIFMIEAEKIEKCTIKGPETIHLRVPIIKNSVLQAEIHISPGNPYGIWEGNIFEDKAYLSRLGMKYRRNKFMDTVYFGTGQGINVRNNFFHSLVSFGSSNIVFVHNNFGYNSSISGGGLAVFVNNNINRFKYLVTPKKLERNNYISNDINTHTISEYDLSPRYYDPLYTANNDLHVNNPSLISAAKYLGDISYDIDLEARDSKRTIGADEICLNSVIHDTVYVECGTNYFLKHCPDTSIGKLYWKPGKYLTDSMEINPTVIVDTTILLYLEDSLGSIVDSMIFIPNSIKKYGTRTYYEYCGNEISLATDVPGGSTVSWMPDSILDDPFSSNVKLTTNTSVQLVATIDMGKCGIFRDTIDLIIIPNAYFSPQIEGCFKALFEIPSQCYDSVLWDFDDGTISNLPIITHTFPFEGVYNVSLTNWYNGLVSTYSYSFRVSCWSVQENLKEKFVIYPNPNMGKFTIKLNGQSNGELCFYNALGRVVYRQEFSNRSSIEIELPQTIVNGVYLIQLISGDQRSSQTIVVRRE